MEIVRIITSEVRPKVIEKARQIILIEINNKAQIKNRLNKPNRAGKSNHTAKTLCRSLTNSDCIILRLT